MRAFFKNNFPILFNSLKRIYYRTPIYKGKVKRRKIFYEQWKKQRLIEDMKLLKEVFEDQCIVHNGPFKGLKYISRSSGSAFLPKIMGSYEEPIQEWINKVLLKNYKTIIDIGCAEGYYTAGFAMLIPNASIIAYDIDQLALKNAEELATLNNLTNVEFRSECTHAELNAFSNKNTLVFCDIEGFENILLDPVKVPNLQNVDLIIESHDFIIEGVSELLIQRFIKTHKISIAVDYPFKLNQYQTPNDASKEQFERIVNEYRQPFTKFILMEHFELDNHAL